MSISKNGQGQLDKIEEVSIAELYHENSKQQRYDLEFSRRISMVNNDPQIHELISRAFKVYPGATGIALPEVVAQEGLSVEQAISMRRSVRHFRAQPLTQLELAKLLYLGHGITGYIGPSTHGAMQPVRAAPSGGALFPVEIYLCISHVENIEPGLYHYRVDNHSLELIKAGDVSSTLAEATSDHSVFDHAAITLVLTLMLSRTRFKYGERGYRFALLEAGHVAQNILLEAVSLKLGAVCVGGFIDDEINDLLNIDGVDETSVYLVAAGKPEFPPVESRGSESSTFVESMLRSMLSVPGTNDPVRPQ
jgi:SagB-type dehydrogenase family enzyme